MSSKLAHVSSIAALACLAGGPPLASAEPAKSPARQCFWTHSVSGYNAVDDRTILVHVGVNDVYRLDLFGPCPDVDWSETIALVSRGTTRICSGLDAEIVTPSTIGPRRCAVQSVTKLTPEEAKAAQHRRRSAIRN